ncbi:MAG: acyl-CoA/acyl-ACP dehydrogenase [Nocardioidaceae bacterium]|nr:MAG: acyl-CoA/acyl-ACP dehydrogenase [Nocardioidaceae bacterium]
MSATADPLLSADQRELVDGLAALCDRHLSDELLADLDARGEYPHVVMDALVEGGWSSLPVSQEAGGAGVSAGDLAVVHEELARHSLVVSQAYFSLWVLGAEAIGRLGTPQQREHWLPAIAERGANVAFALTEPGSGSDAAALSTKAVSDGDEFVVSGQKVFITGAAVADTIVTAVRTSSADRKQEGITLLMIDPTLPGVTFRKLSKIGIRALDLCEVFFEDVRVSGDAVLGEVDKGWDAILPGLAMERLFLSALSVGALRDLVERCSEHALMRTAFGKPLASHQLIADKIIEMKVAVDRCRGLVKQAAAMVDLSHPDAVTAASVAKLEATRSYVSACREAIQVFGGYGFTDEYAVSRHYRDCKYLEIGGGSSEIQKIVIGRSMGFRL